jgi:hypothetical protein
VPVVLLVVVVTAGVEVVEVIVAFVAGREEVATPCEEPRASAAAW